VGRFSRIPQKKVELPVMTMTRTPSSLDAVFSCSRNTVINSCERALRLEGLFNARTRTPSTGVEATANGSLMMKIEE
jgi:hypothetical protein